MRHPDIILCYAEPRFCIMLVTPRWQIIQLMPICHDDPDVTVPCTLKRPRYEWNIMNYGDVPMPFDF